MSAVRGFGLRADLRRLKQYLLSGFQTTRLVRDENLPNTTYSGDPVANALGSDRSINLFRVLLTISAEIDGPVAARHTKALIKSWVRTFAERFPASALSGPERCQRLLEFVFQELGFQAGAVNSKASYLSSLLIVPVVREREGHCVGLASLILVLAEQLDLNIYAVSLPGHVFCRYDDGKIVFNIETTAHGARWSREKYLEKLKLPADLPENSAFLRNLSKRQFIAEVLNNRGHYFWRKGLVDEAARDLYRSTRCSDTFTRGHAAKGFMALCQGRIEVAVVELGRAWEIDQYSPRLPALLGEALLEAGSYKRAVETLKLALEQDETNAFAWSLLGRGELQLENIEAANRAHKRAVSIEPDNAMYLNNYGVFKAVVGETEAAIEAFSKAFKLDSRQVTAAVNIARLDRVRPSESMKSLLNEIQREFEQRVAARPRDQRALIDLARLVSLTEGSPAIVEEYCARAEGLGPHAEVYELFAELALERQEWFEGLRWVQRGLATRPLSRTRRRLYEIKSEITEILAREVESDSDFVSTRDLSEGAS